MRHEDRGEYKRGHHYRGGHDKRKEHHRGAQTFRRGRAIEFLQRMEVKRTTLRQQLDAPEFQPLQKVILGELKAIEMVIDEFVQLFELHELEVELPAKPIENSSEPEGHA